MNSAISEKLTGLQNAIIASNVPQIVMYVISYALDLRASDIHMEPEERTVRVRFRVDGVLQQIVEYPVNLHAAVVSRIKIMSNLKIDETRIPQDGRTQVTTRDGREMDLRVSTLPTVNGEKVVMRIQDKSKSIPTLTELGITDHNLEIVKRAIEAPNGIVLTTGPTGSGKTTTLYACLSILNKPEVNILTIEDPVEIQMNGLNQSQVHPDIGYTFAAGLRSALRQDPDIIMVGEVRDRETAEVATEAALTGHLVFSTLHTNSAAATITRIIDMGIPGFLITATLNAIIAQRLVRRVCPKCSEESEVTVEVEKKLTAAIASMNDKERERIGADKKGFKIKVYRGKGCEACSGIGYRGRVGLYEIMEMNNTLKDMILRSASTHDIEEAAVKSGMRTLEHDGIARIMEGLTTPEEVYNVARQGEA